jgi:NAD(P)-dependent dehydrogenase (short-subunit alcohol dehydrogenase family)
MVENRAAIVTGAASGIGRATAQLLAAEGAAVIVADVDEQGAGDTVRLIDTAGGSATAVVADVTNAEQVAAMVQTAVDTYGGLDILHANAGVPGPDRPLVDWSREEWESVLAVNLTGVFVCCQAAIPAVARQGGGSIVITASAAGIQAVPFTCAYNA